MVRSILAPGIRQVAGLRGLRTGTTEKLLYVAVADPLQFKNYNVGFDLNARLDCRPSLPWIAVRR